MAEKTLAEKLKRKPGSRMAVLNPPAGDLSTFLPTSIGDAE
jgi:hypothetical protein